MVEHLEVDAAQSGTGIDAQFVAECDAGGVVGRERVGLPPRSIEGGHESLPTVLAERVLLDHGLQHRDRGGRVAEPEQRLGAVGQQGDLRGDDRFPVRSGPIARRSGQRVSGGHRRRVARGEGRPIVADRQEALYVGGGREQRDGVDCAPVDVEAVSRGGAGDDVAAQHPAQFGHLGLE